MKEQVKVDITKEIGTDFFLCPNSVLGVKSFFAYGFSLCVGDAIETVNGKLIMVTTSNIERLNKKNINEEAWIVKSQEVLAVIRSRISKAEGDANVSQFNSSMAVLCTVIGSDPSNEDNVVVSVRDGCGPCFMSVHQDCVKKV